MEQGKLIISRTKELSDSVSSLSFSFDGFIYNPLEYAWEAHKQFLEKYVDHKVKVLFLGMNPGPFGMMQTGVPFGEINAVKNYLKINAKINKPVSEHPNRPVLGLDTKRSEVSGQRLWSLISSVYPDPYDFFKDQSVFNYCPLGFLMNTKTAKNETPDHLVKPERDALEKICSSYLADVIDILSPSFLIGVGKYAQSKLESVSSNQLVTSIIHPSPGNPQANNNWAGKTYDKLKEIGVWN